MKKILGFGLLLCSAAWPVAADTLSDILEYTYENSTTITANRAGLKAVDESVAQAKSGYRPQISAQGSISRAHYENTYYNA